MGAPGFDDAPTVAVPNGRTPKTVQFVYPYYENPGFLKRQLDLWSSYPDSLRLHLRGLIADDGSPNSPAAEVLKAYPAFPFPLRLFRIGIDVRWNWLAARNIALHHASDGWVLMTDMDHMIEEAAAFDLVHGEHNPAIIYRLARREHTGAVIHCHPNTTFLTRSMFWKAGGYDEALSGHYGTDGDWRRRLAATAKVQTLTTAVVRHEYVADSSTTRYKRKQPEDAGKKAIMAKRRLVKNWRPKVLSFPYHEVEL